MNILMSYSIKEEKNSIMESLPPSLSSDDEDPNIAEAESSDDEVDGSFSFGGVLVSLVRERIDMSEATFSPCAYLF